MTLILYIYVTEASLKYYEMISLKKNTPIILAQRLLLSMEFSILIPFFSPEKKE